MSQDCLEVSPVDVKIDLEICPGISGWNPVSQETGSPQSIVPRLDDTGPEILNF